MWDDFSESLGSVDQGDGEGGLDSGGVGDAQSGGVGGPDGIKELPAWLRGLIRIL
jgi:hypothetical protein